MSRFQNKRDTRLTILPADVKPMTRDQRRVLQKKARELRVRASDKHRARVARQLEAAGLKGAAPVAVPNVAFRKGRAVSGCADAAYHKAVCATLPSVAAEIVARWVSESPYRWGHAVVGRHLGYLVSNWEMSRPSTRKNVVMTTVGVSRRLLATCILNPSTGTTYSFETIKNSETGSIAWGQKLGLILRHQPPAHAVPASMKGPPRDDSPDGFAFNIYRFPEAVWTQRTYHDGRHLPLELRKHLLPNIWGDDSVDISWDALPEASEEDDDEEVSYVLRDAVADILSGWGGAESANASTGPPAPS